RGEPLLALAQRRFDSAPLGDVAPGADDAHETAVLENGEPGAADPADLAIRAHDAKLHRVAARAVGQRGVEYGSFDASAVGRMNASHERLVRSRLLGAEAEHHPQASIPLRPPRVGIPAVHSGVDGL